MKKVLRISGIVIAAVLVLAAAGIIYFLSTTPSVGDPEDIRVERTSERIRRGEYLVHHVTLCVDCHSERDWNFFSGPIKPGTEGKGGERFGEEMGLPGVLYAKNITPSHLGDWSDGELLRMITSGVNKNGDVAFPLMPYPSYNVLSREDAYSIIAYIRSMSSIENSGIPASTVNFPVNLIMRTIPKPYRPQVTPDREDETAYGRYLTTIAGCAECHTPREKGEPIPGMDFAGGFEFALPAGTVRSANITPDPHDGIGEWSREFFIKRFKFYEGDSARAIVPDQSGFNTVMPWTMYAGMTEEDLGAIYAYFRTVKPIRHKIERWTKN